jgi:hypothetical protein
MFVNVKKQYPETTNQALASDSLDADAVEAGARCVEVRDWADAVADADVVNLGLRGELRVDARAADDDDCAVVLREACLRKTRAGGNWLIGGIVEVWGFQVMMVS